ncbi:hypothetical protein LAZ67_8002588, partial [Cordylochernes scorpioides]
MFSEGREDVNDEERAGRSSTSTTDEKINEVEKMILANRRITVREVAEDLNISIGSCHSIFINDLGMRRVAAKFVPKLLNCDQKQHRMNIANEMLDSVRDDPNLLQRVITDESRFCLSSDSRRVRVWRRRGERSNPAAIVERPTVRQRGIMVWGAIAYDSRSPLLRIQGTMTAQIYVDDVLRPVTLPYLQGVPNALYQQDNARPHTARISQQALQDVQMLPWPPYSPDLSPIEHVWDIIGRRLHALPQPRSEDELWQMVEREWRAIPQDAIRSLIDSLPRRVAACIAVRVCARWLPRLLSENHKQQRMEAALVFLEMYRRDGDQLFSRIVTGDESWVHHSTPETKRQSMVWKKPEESAPKKAKVTISAGKVMAIVFWDCKGVLLVDYLPPNSTVNAARYCEVLNKLRAAIKRKRPGLLSRKVLLVHDNARPHAARTTQTLLENFKWEIFTHPPYSPELAPSDFHLFPALKLHLGGKHFANDNEVQAEANHWLRRQDTAWYNSVPCEIEENEDICRKKNAKCSPIPEKDGGFQCLWHDRTVLTKDKCD